MLSTDSFLCLGLTFYPHGWTFWLADFASDLKEKRRRQDAPLPASPISQPKWQNVYSEWASFLHGLLSCRRFSITIKISFSLSVWHREGECGLWLTVIPQMIAFQFPSHAPSLDPFCGSAARKNSSGPYYGLLLWIWANLLIKGQAFFTLKKFVYISSSQIPFPLHPVTVINLLFSVSPYCISMGFGSKNEMYVCALSAIFNKNFYCLFRHLCDFFFLYWGKRLLIAST